jgi:hypothetical protein
LPRHLQTNADLDTAYHFDVDSDPDAAYHFDADPDPTFQLMRIYADSDPQHCSCNELTIELVVAGDSERLLRIYSVQYIQGPLWIKGTHN